jgi:hypothetical protein
MKTPLWGLGLLSLLGLLAACQTGPRVTRTGSPGEVYVQGHLRSGLEIDGLFNADGTLDRSQFLDAFFPGTQLKLTDMRSAPTESGFVEVQATIQNTSRTRERIEYRYRWIDERGMEVAIGTSGWRSETIEPRESRVLSGVTREPGVVSFQLFVRTYQPRK